MTTAAAYVRVSKEEQAEKDLSIPAQKSRIIAYCQSQGWDLLDIDSYVDDGYSSVTLDRPGMQKLLKDCSKRLFQVVVVVKLDRISRKQKDVLYLLEDVFEANKVGFKSVTQTFDTTNAFGKASIGMLAVFAQLERDQLIERIIDTKQEAAKQGRFQGGTPSYGYKHNPLTKSLEIDEAQADIIHYIYDRYLHGDTGYQAIADELNERKILPAKAKTWSRAAVQKILTNPSYTGMTPYYDQLYQGKHQAIISQEQFDQVQKLLGSRNKYLPSIHSGLVSGMIYCGECGARMRTKNVWQNHPCTDPKRVIRYYLCYSQDGSTHYMVRDPNCRCGYKQSDVIDAKVIAMLTDYSLSPQLVRKAMKEASEGSSSQAIGKTLSGSLKELETLKKRIDRWYDAFERGALEPNELTERVRELRDRKATLEQEIIKCEEQIENEKLRSQSIAVFASLLRQFSVLWPKATPDERKIIIKNLVKEVRIYQDDHIDLVF